jgi:hypothetical protein
MVDKSSHDEYLATYVDDILISRKNPMTVIKSLENTYVSKHVDISEYYLAGNIDLLSDRYPSFRRQLRHQLMAQN